MNYTQKLQHTLLAAQVQERIACMSLSQLAKAKELAMLANAEKNGAAAVLISLVKAMQEEGQDAIAALLAAQAEVKAHQDNIEALATAIRARQIALAEEETETTATANKGGGDETD